MTTPHPHADLLHAIADGKQMQGRLQEAGCDWFDIYPDQALGAIVCDYSMKIRIKPDVAGAFSAGAALSTAAQPLTQDEQGNQLCMSSASCGQASTNESAFITSTQRSAGTFSASSERQSYRDSDGMPTERAVLEREWRRMKIALSAPAAQPPAGFVLVPIELAQRVQETMGEFLMDHGWRQQDMDTSDEFDAALAAAVPAPATKEGGA